MTDTMKIAIISDTHDHIPNLRRAVNRAMELGATLLIHCGDLISPFMLPELHRFAGPVHLIYGNNVGDQHLISSRCETMFDNIHHHGVQGEVEAGRLRIGFFHYPALARGLALTGRYDVVCCGHNHIAATEQIGDCLLINPGDMLGKDMIPGFMLLDSEKLAVHRIEVGERLHFDD